PPPGRTRSLFQLFFGTPMGGVPSAPLPVTLPNDLGLDPGQKAQLWYYDAAPLPNTAAAWRLAGLGTVSDDGQTIVSDPGVGIALLDVSVALRRLVLPGNARYDFAREPDDRFVNRSNPRLRGAVVVQEPDGVQALRFGNGSVWRFRGGWVGRGRIRPIAGLN